MLALAEHDVLTRCFVASHVRQAWQPAASVVAEYVLPATHAEHAICAPLYPQPGRHFCGLQSSASVVPAGDVIEPLCSPSPFWAVHGLHALELAALPQDFAAHRQLALDVGWHELGTCSRPVPEHVLHVEHVGSGPLPPLLA